MNTKEQLKVVRDTAKQAYDALTLLDVAAYELVRRDIGEKLEAIEDMLRGDE